VRRRQIPPGRKRNPTPTKSVVHRAQARVPRRSKMLTAIEATEGHVHDGGDGWRAGGRSLPRGRLTLPPPAHARARVSDEGVQHLLATIAATEGTCTTIGEF
jgi:hypothetical protein